MQKHVVDQYSRMFSLNVVKILVAAVLRACVSKRSDWQVGPPRSLLTHAVSLKVSNKNMRL